MNEKSEQINIRASERVARDLRLEAQRRGLPLGETLEQLLALARADSQPGAWVELDAVGERALRAVAAARGLAPAAQLAGMARGYLRDQLIELAAQLEPGSAEPVVDAIGAVGGATDGLQRHAREGHAGVQDARELATSLKLGSEEESSVREAEGEETIDRVGIFSVFE